MFGWRLRAGNHPGDHVRMISEVMVFAAMAPYDSASHSIALVEHTA
jgi:hypothetical protein